MLLTCNTDCDLQTVYQTQWSHLVLARRWSLVRFPIEGMFADMPQDGVVYGLVNFPAAGRIPYVECRKQAGNPLGGIPIPPD